MSVHNTNGRTPIVTIHPKFAWRVASRYVTIYQRDGFAEAQKYLETISKGDTELQQHLVPFIVDEGTRRK